MENRRMKKMVCGVGGILLVSSALMLMPQTGRVAHAQTAVIATVEADFSGGAHSIASVDPVGGLRTVVNDLAPTFHSDLTVAAFGRYFYRIEKYQADTITKYDVTAPSTLIWQYSALDAGDTVSANPYDLIFASAQKAYLLRYGKTNVWIVDPTAGSEADFKIGELDLSAYADADGIPEMNSGVIVNGKLFITMQRVDRNSYFAASNDAYVAVFDVASDTEIDTGTVNPIGVPGVHLTIRDTGAIQYVAADGLIYIQGVGDPYGSGSYSGGIVSLDPDTYAVTSVLDDGDDTRHPYGYISGMSIVSPTQGYFVGYAGWGDNTLYMFNPTTGVVDGVVDAALTGINIAGMESGAYVDKNNFLWVCDQTNAQVVILNTSNNTIDESVSTSLNPIRVVFADETAAADDGGGSGGNDGGNNAPGSCFVSSLLR